MGSTAARACVWICYYTHDDSPWAAPQRARVWICYYTHDDSPWAAPQRVCVWVCYYTQAALDAVVIANNPV